ncbi:MAG: DUF3144 domain-containing protein [Cocleimonas sp.]
MNDKQQQDKEFFKTADTFIDLANDHSNKQDSAAVGSSLLYATARFSSFVVASHAKDLESFESEIDHAIEFFNKEFERMLKENLEEYKGVFSKEQEQPKYQHLIKKSTE